MYNTALVLIISSSLFIISNIYTFFANYKTFIIGKRKGKEIYFSILFLLSSIGTLLLGIVNIFVINNQL